MTESELSYADQFLGELQGLSPGEALDKLSEFLSEAAKCHAANPDGRLGVKLAMEIMTGFVLARFGPDRASTFAALYAGLEGLDSGIVTPLLAKKRTPGIGNRPRDSRERREIKAFAVATVDALRDTFGYDGASAKATVAVWLNRSGIAAGGRNVTETSMRNWRAESQRDPYRRERVDAYRPLLAPAKSPETLKIALGTLIKTLGKPAC
jgi:hypothetical protein